MVIILAPAAAVLYGTADFLAGVASRRASVFAVLALTVPAGAGVVLLVALLPPRMSRPSVSQDGVSRDGEGQHRGPSRLRGVGYGVAAGAGFGLFYLFLKNAGQSGVLWPVAVSRTTGSLIAFGIVLGARIRPWRHGSSGIVLVAMVSGAVDAAANVCYVLATRAGLFGLAVVITSLYPGMTVLLARWLLGERMRWLQRAGLLLAAAGAILLTT